MRTVILTIVLMMTGHASAMPLACLIEPDMVAEVGTQVIGIIDSMTVERGDTVKQGQVLAHLKADVERASLQVAAVRAQAEGELRAAIATHDFAQAKVVRTRELVAVGFISKEAMDQAETDARVAQNHVTQIQEAQNVSRQELALSHSQLDQRLIRSPFSGIVVERYRTKGERIEREPVLRIAKINPLRVEVILPVAQFGQVRPGASVSIHTDIPGKSLLSAKVVLVDNIIDAASNTFRVRLTLPNPDYSIPAGVRCSANFDGITDASARQSAPRADKGTGIPPDGKPFSTALKLSKSLSP
jgi:RND family efflux transporter MFP subunit